MRYLLITLLMLLSLTGCEYKDQQSKDQAKHDAQIAQQARAELLAEQVAKKARENNDTQKKENIKLTKMGIHMKDGTITIDTNKTKDFFNDLGKKMDLQMKKISDDMEKGIIETKKAGIEMNKEHIHIDLNKTQNLLEEWGKKIQLYME